jgi:CheY-like chemotaxis protein
MNQHAMRILVVEDNELFREIIQRGLLAEMLKAMPESVVSFVSTLDAMMATLASLDRPDVTILDLGVPPNTMAETLSRLDMIEEHTPVVILTGNQEEAIRAKIGHRLTPVVEKNDQLIKDPGILHRAIVFAVEYWQHRKWARVKANIDIMKSICHVPPR